MADEVTSLVLAVDSTDVNSAAAALDKFAQAGNRAETSAKGVEAGAAAIAQTAPAANTAANALARAQKSSAGLGAQQKLTAFQTQQLGFQLNDFFVQVASGQSPVTAAIQQGSQLAGTFGGIRGALAALGTILTPTVLALGAVATVVGGISIAAYQGNQETKEFNKALQLTGNYAGQTADSFSAAARSIKDLSGGTIGQAREITLALAATGKFGAESLDSVGAAALRLKNITGQSSDEVVSYFSKMRDGVTDFAVQANRQFNYLTGAQFKYIQQLEAQGKFEQAAKVNADALNQALKDRQPQLGSIERLLKSGKDLWSEYWNAALNVGRPKSLGDQLSEVQSQLDRLGRRRGPQNAFADLQEQQLQGDRGALNRSLLNRSEQAAAAADSARKNQQEIFEATAQYQAAQNDVTRAGLQTRFELAQQYAEQERVYLDRSYETANLTLAGYQRARLLIETQALKAQESLINAQIDLEKKAVTQGSPEEIQLQQLAKQQRILDLQRQQLPIQTQLLKLQEQYRRGQLLPDTLVNQAVPIPTDALRAFENAQRAQTEQAYADRKIAAMQAGSELVQVNKDLSIQLIRDDRQRGQAQIDADVEVYRKRLELATLSAEDRKSAEASLADYRLKREQQLTEQLKPEWERQLENWRDTVKLMKDAADELGNGLLSTAEDAFAEFAKTGKFNIKSVFDFFASEAARVTFRFAAGQYGDLFSSIFKGLTGGSYSFNGGVGTTNAAGISGGRALGGPVSAGRMYEVTEGGRPELLSTGGKQYLMMGASGGSVKPTTGSGGGVVIDQRGQVLNIGSNVSRGEMVQALQAVRAQTIHDVRRLRQQGSI